MLDWAGGGGVGGEPEGKYLRWTSIPFSGDACQTSNHIRLKLDSYADLAPLNSEGNERTRGTSPRRKRYNVHGETNISKNITKMQNCNLRQPSANPNLE